MRQTGTASSRFGIKTGPLGTRRARPGPAVCFRGITGADLLLFGAVAAVALAIGVVNALSIAQDAAWRGGAYELRTPLFWEMSSIATIILVAPVLFVAVRRLRRASTWPGRIALAAGAIVVFSALHIAGMVGHPQARAADGRRLLRFPLLACDRGL